MASSVAALVAAALLSAAPAPSTAAPAPSTAAPAPSTAAPAPSTAAAAPPAARPAPREGSARIAGLLALRQRGRAVSLAEAQRLAGGKRVGLAFRSGWDVVAARLEADGRFLAEVSPGTWRLEWIDVGDDAEALAAPLVVEASAGATACAGLIELAFDDLESELGANAAGAARVEDRCGQIGGVAALARPADDPPPGLDVGLVDVLAGIRTEASSAGKNAVGLRLSWAIPFRRPPAWKGNVFLLGAASRVLADAGDHEAFEAGAGFAPAHGLELAAGGRVRTGGGSAVAPFAGVRWGGLAYALTARAVFEEGGITWHVGLDVTPYFVVGRFL